MGNIKKYFHNFFFEQSDAPKRISILRILVMAICLLMLLLGPYDTAYHINFADIMFQAHFPLSFFTPLGENFRWIKLFALGSGLCALCGYHTRFSLPIFTFFYCFLNYYIHCFQEHYCMNQAHLNIALITLCCVPSAKTMSLDALRSQQTITSSAYEACSFALTFIGGYIALLFFQTGLSKLIYGGIGWFLSGDTLYVETILDGTDIGRSLTTYSWAFPLFGITVGLFELLFPFFFLFARFRALFGYILLLFHFGTFLVMGITFWFLWPLYIPLYIMSGKRTAIPAGVTTAFTSTLKKEIPEMERYTERASKIRISAAPKTRGSLIESDPIL